MEEKINLSSGDTAALEREVLRQYEENERYLRRYEDEAKAIMAFIIGFFIYAVSFDFIEIISKRNIILQFLFFCCLLFTIGSFIATFKTYKIEHNASGSRIGALIKKQKDGTSLRAEIILDLLKSNEINVPKLKRKGESRNLSLILFFIGFLIYISIKFIYLFFY